MPNIKISNTLRKRISFFLILILIIILQSCSGEHWPFPSAYESQSGNAAANKVWYSSIWQYRQQIVISSAITASDQSDFPLLIRVSDQSNPLFDNARPDGDDIFFTLFDGTRLDHEIEYYKNTATKELDAWVRIPDLSSSIDTVIYMYYGNNSAVNQANADAVWDSNFEMVLHLNESPSDGVAGHMDSTVNGNKGTPENFQNGTGTTDAVGKIGGADDFAGDDDYIAIQNLNYNTAGQISELTACAWFRTSFIGSSWVENWAIVDFDRSDYFNFFVYGDTGELGFATAHQTAGIVDMQGNTQVNDGQWHFGCVVFDSSEVNDKKIYFDGGLDFQQDAYSTNENLGTGNIRYGFIGDGSEADVFDGARNNQYYEGSIDEVRISSIARSPEWIMAVYDNQRDPEFYLTVGAEETDDFAPAGEWQYRQNIAISSLMAPSDQTDFPVLIRITDPNNPVFANAQPDGDDILFTLSDMLTKLEHEIERFDNTPGSEDLVAWVRVTALSSLTDTIIFMYYGNAGVSSQENINEVWDADYAGVWHLKEEQAGTGSFDLYQDSVSNSNDGGDDYVSATGKSGQINSGQQFDGVDDYVSTSSIELANSSFTVEAWVNPDIGPPGQQCWFEAHTSFAVTGGESIHLRINSNGSIRFGYYWDDLDTAAGVVQFGAWNHIVVSYDNNTDESSIYYNGVLNISGNQGPFIGASPRISIGKWDTQYFNGAIDEVRVSNSLRSADWITTNYNNQNNPAGFLTFSVEEML